MLKDSKSHKKHKKDKKHKKEKREKKHNHRRSRSRPNSSESRISSNSRHHHRYQVEEKKPKHNSEYERLKKELAAFKSGKTAVAVEEKKNNLGPDMNLYSSRQREIEEKEKLRKA